MSPGVTHSGGPASQPRQPCGAAHLSTSSQHLLLSDVLILAILAGGTWRDLHFPDG